MGKDNIEKYSAFYAALKSVASFWHNKVFYRKIIIIGRENINPDDHLIYAPNHQNALMDALAVLFCTRGQLVFLARADIFKKKFIASMLYTIKILPVYRIRDGYESLKSNDWVFNKTIDVLRNKNGLGILPEGNHEGMRRLRQLKKGICRIAFQADEETGFTMNIKIVPVGLEYSNYSRIRQVLTVVFGKPIEVSEFYESYRKKPERAMNELRERLSQEMQQLMVHIESVVDYEAIDELRSIINSKYSDDKNMPKLFRDRILINSLNRLRTTSEETYRRICDLSLKVRTGALRLKTDYRLLEKKRHSLPGMIGGLLALVLTFPLFLYGVFFNYLFISIPDMPLKKIRDVQFHSSIRYTVSLLLAFVLMPLYLILSFVIFSPWWLAALVFISIPFAGLFAWNYHLLYNRISGGLRIRKYVKTGSEEYRELRANFDELVSLVSKLSTL
jgi:1-acyl-sn-glycerol-3-phosphate acyltransferase